MINMSVIMSCYNERKPDIIKSINSILEQTYKLFEFIIIVDNPKNNEIIETIKKFKDKRIKVIINEKNIGLAESLNKGISIAKGKYIARMDADDISLPNRLKMQFDYLESHPNIDVVGSNRITIDENDEIIADNLKLPISDKKIKKQLPYASVIIHPSVMFRKNKILSIGKYRAFPAAQDYDLWLRCLTSNYNFYNIEVPLIKYRIRKNSISKSNTLKQFLISLYIIQLFKERNKKHADSFSVENLNKYLNDNDAYDINEIKKFDESLELYNEAKKYIKKFKLIKGSKKICKAIKTSRFFKKFLYLSLEKNLNSMF